MDKRTILVFGLGELQKSLIERAKAMDLFVVGVDPSREAHCRELVDAFELVDGRDYDKTLAVAKKYNVSAIITAATDKPLLMMARIAKELNLVCFSEKTAIISTDKFLMKEVFLRNKIPCAKGQLISNINEIVDFSYPIIIKPRDNSGSRGVFLCENEEALEKSFGEALQFTNKNTVLVEEFIEGKEYSIESIHVKGHVEIVQFTEKSTTSFPYNVELGHIQPVDISEKDKAQIKKIIQQVADCLEFDNCASHTELKINKRGIFIIETSPRLGGDYITSTLVPLSTGINMEDLLIKISLGDEINRQSLIPKFNKCSGISFFSLPVGVVIQRNNFQLETICCLKNIVSFSFLLHEGDKVNLITSSLNRYGHVIVQEDSVEALKEKIRDVTCILLDSLKIV